MNIRHFLAIFSERCRRRKKEPKTHVPVNKATVARQQISHFESFLKFTYCRNLVDTIHSQGHEINIYLPWSLPAVGGLCLGVPFLFLFIISAELLCVSGFSRWEGPSLIEINETHIFKARKSFSKLYCVLLCRWITRVLRLGWSSSSTGIRRTFFLHSVE